LNRAHTAVVRVGSAGESDVTDVWVGAVENVDFVAVVLIGKVVGRARSVRGRGAGIVC